MTDPQLFTALQEGTEQAAQVILRFRGRVENKGKPGDHLTLAGAALTDIDEIAQEIILAKVYAVAPEIRVNAEEDTPLRKLFRNNTSEITLHLDPIDGTLSYLEGREYFATGCALSIGDQFTHTLIRAPARDETYIATPHAGLVRGREKVKETPRYYSNTLFAKNIFSERGLAAVRELGYQVIPESYGAHVLSIDAIEDRIAGMIHGFTHPHDMLVPAAFARGCGKIPYGIDGQEVTAKDLRCTIRDGLPVYERVPAVAYFSTQAKDKVLPLMCDQKLWSEEFTQKLQEYKQKEF